MSRATIDWNAYIDAYCERTAPGFWAEPLNSVTNLAFVLAAALLLRALLALPPSPDMPSRRPALAMLIGLLAAIGVGSFLFHTVATRWAAAADVLPIYAFMHVYAACFLRLGAGLPWRLAWLGAPGFFVLAQGVGQVLPPATLGMGGYAPALLALLLFAAWRAVAGDVRWRGLAAGAVVFSVSLALRQADLPLCARWPLGTHFLWHLLNALTLYLVTRALWPVASPRMSASAA